MSTLEQNFRRMFRPLLQGALAKLNLVTREEFDIQTSVLARTRAKLEALEYRVSQLENNHVSRDHS